jgi:hypothetical protein
MSTKPKEPEPHSDRGDVIQALEARVSVLNAEVYQLKKQVEELCYRMRGDGSRKTAA